jgi:hypothetical protein
VAIIAGSSPIKAKVKTNLRIQLGQEYDSNATRIYISESSDMLLRLILDGSFSYSKNNHQLAIKYIGGGKLFYDESDEDLLVNKLVGLYRFFPGKDWSLGTRFVVHDATMRRHIRDFFLGSGEVFKRSRINHWLEWELSLGGQYLFFKPDWEGYSLRKFSYMGPSLGFRFYANSKIGLQSTLHYQLGARFYDGYASSLDGTNLVFTKKDRFELRHSSGVRFRYPIRYYADNMMILELGYFLSVNDSNSYGSSAIWHRVRLVCSAQLPYGFTVHLMGTVQLTDYTDGIYIEGDLYEPNADENENSFIFRINYALSRGLSIVLHGGIYRNDFSSREFDVGNFERETIMMGLAYDLSN